MISFPEAFDLVLRHAPAATEEECDIDDAVGRVLRQDILADRPFPPYDRVMMDGYALRAGDLAGGRRFRVIGSAPAGMPQAALGQAAGCCLEIMTGAPLPRGADCVVPVEWTEIRENGEIVIKAGCAPKAGEFIHRAGSDASMGDLLVEAGTRIGSREIGVAASCGVATLRVAALPSIAIVPTGDELVGIHEVPLPHQIRQSNGHAIRAALASAGYPATLFPPLGDDATHGDVMAIVARHQWVVFTGAVSMGSRDFLPRVLAELGGIGVFHGVAQRPGKPAGFWVGPQGQAIIALPGNPVSALTGLHAFVLPALSSAAGEKPVARQRVMPAGAITGLPRMTWHLPVVLDDRGFARPAPTGNSGDFIGLLGSDGFVTLPPGGDHQEPLPYTPWR